MRPACLLSVVLAMTVPASSLAQSARSDEAVLDEAIGEFERGKQAKDDVAASSKHFTRAADLFAELQQRGVRNPALYLNQGNAELLAGRLGQALLAYHRGLQLAPNDATMRDHRDYARTRVRFASAVGRQPTSAWPPWLPQPTMTFTAIVFFLCYGLTWIAFTRWRMTRERRPLLIGSALLALTMLAGIGAWYLREQEAREEREPFVVVAAADGTALQRGNGESYPRLMSLPQGLEARRLHERGDWLQIQLATGEIGWVRRADVLIDDANWH
jgi:hypothetical protein